MKYWIGERILSPRAAAVEITEKEFLSLSMAKAVIVSSHSLEIKFHIIAECYKSLELGLFELAFDRSMEGLFDRKVTSEIVIRINQLLLSLLTAARTYHDQRPQDLGTFSTEASPWASNGEEIFHTIFDNSLDYRVMEALRNYAQHNRLPITKFFLGSSRTSKETGISSQRNTIDPEIALADLAQSDKVRKKTRDELLSLKLDWIDLKFAMREYVFGLISDHNAIRAMLSDTFDEAKGVYYSFVDRYRSSNTNAKDAPFVFAYSEPSSGDPIYLGIDVIEEVERMSRVHPSATGLSSRYVSTEVVRQNPNHPSSAR